MKSFLKKKRGKCLHTTQLVLFLSTIFLASIFFRVGLPQIAHAAGFDAWQSGFAAHTAYTAATDGFVVADVANGWTGDHDCTTNLLVDGVSRQYGRANNDGVQQSMMSPVRKGEQWQVESNDHCPTIIYWIPLFFPSETGIVILKATKDGVAWDSPAFTVNAELVGVNPPGDVSIDPEQNLPGMPVGTYRINSVTPPSGVTLQNINGSPVPYSQTLTTGGTITFTFNFITPPPAASLVISRTRATTPTTPFRVGDFTTFFVHGPASLFATNQPANVYRQIGLFPAFISDTSDTFAMAANICDAATGVCVVSGNWSAAQLVCPAGVTGIQQTTEWLVIGSMTSNKIQWYFECSNVSAVPTLVVSPTSPSVQVGGTQLFTAIYDPDDGTGPRTVTATSWSSSDISGRSVATIDSSGLATGRSVGSVSITATYAGLTATPATLYVTAPVPGLIVIPPSASVPINSSQQFTACFNPNGTPVTPLSAKDCVLPDKEVTTDAATSWSSDDGSKVTIVPNGPSGGLAKRVGNSTTLTTIRAQYAGLLAEADVLDPARITIITTPPTTPPAVSLKFGESTQLQACLNPNGPVTTADCSGGSETFVTESSNWSPISNSIASVNNTTSKGLVMAGSTRIGSVIVSATYSGVPSATARITVIAPAFSVSCSALPVLANIDDSVTWTAIPSGGTGSYTYFWSGSSPLGGQTGNPVTVSYATTGTKTGSVTVTSGSQTVLQMCSTSVSIGSALTIPAAPSSLRVDAASLNSCGAIRLTWQDNSNNEDNFELERDSGSGFVNIANPVANAISYTDTNISQNTSYLYRIRACNTVGCSAYSNTVTGDNQSPNADFSWRPQTPQVNQPTLFMDVSTPFGGATIVRRQWTFQDGNPAVAIGAATTTRFVNASPAQKSVALSVTDSASRACSITKSVTVSQGTPGEWCELPPDAPPGTPCP